MASDIKPPNKWLPWPTLLPYNDAIHDPSQANLQLQGGASNGDYSTSQEAIFSSSKGQMRVFVKRICLLACSNRMKEKFEASAEICRFAGHGKIYHSRPEDYLKGGPLSPNVVGLLDILQNSNVVYFIYKLAPQGSLFDLISRDEEEGKKRYKEATLSLLNVVKYLDSYGISHRAITLPNVLLDNDVVKLTGFHSAVKVYRRNDSSTFVLLQTKESRSTRNRHFPPECFHQAQYDARNVDVFACLLVGVNLSTARHPFNPVSDVRYSLQWKSFQDLYFRGGHLEFRRVASSAFCVDSMMRKSAQTLLAMPFFCQPNREGAQNRNNTKSTLPPKPNTTSKKSGKSKSKSTGKTLNEAQKAKPNVGQVKRTFEEPGTTDISGITFDSVTSVTEAFSVFKGRDEQSAAASQSVPVLVATAPPK